MNISPFFIYSWQLADKLIQASTIICMLALIAAILAFTVGSAVIDMHPESERAIKSLRKNSLRSGLAALLVWVFTPSSNTVAMMVVIPEISKSQVIQKDLPELYSIAIEALKSGLKPETK